jgi:2-methylthioadenine synthetase
VILFLLFLRYANGTIFDRITYVKKIYLVSLGCAKNQVDSEILLTEAKETGYTVTDNAEEADVIVINSCGFIESAKTESIETVLSYREAFPKAKIVLAGCLAQRYVNDIEMEEADAVFGNHDLSAFPEVLKDLESGEEEQIKLAPEYPDPDRERDDRSVLLSLPRSAYLKISEGCDHRCNYCAIPVIRGPLRSRPEEAVLAEARRLIAQGIYEINIIAQDLGAYGTDWDGKSHFCTLIKKLANLEGDFVLRMLYIHPDTFPRELISIVRDNKRFFLISTSPCSMRIRWCFAE